MDWRHSKGACELRSRRHAEPCPSPPRIPPDAGLRHWNSSNLLTFRFHRRWSMSAIWEDYAERFGPDTPRRRMLYFALAHIADDRGFCERCEHFIFNFAWRSGLGPNGTEKVLRNLAMAGWIAQKSRGFQLRLNPETPTVHGREFTSHNFGSLQCSSSLPWTFHAWRTADTRIQRIVLLGIANLADGAGLVERVTTSDLRRICRLSQKSISRTLKKLASCGRIRIIAQHDGHQIQMLGRAR